MKSVILLPFIIFHLNFSSAEEFKSTNKLTDKELIEIVTLGTKEQIVAAFKLNPNVNLKNKTHQPFFHIGVRQNKIKLLMEILFEYKETDVTILNPQGETFLEFYYKKFIKKHNNSKRYIKFVAHFKSYYPKQFEKIMNFLKVHNFDFFEMTQKALSKTKIAKVTPENQKFINILLTESSEEIKGLLLDPDFDVNLKNKKGYTPLHTLAERGLLSAMEAFLESPDIDVANLNFQNQTFLELFYKRILKSHKSLESYSRFVLLFKSKHPEKYKKIMNILKKNNFDLYKINQTEVSKFKLVDLNEEDRRFFRLLRRGGVNEIIQAIHERKDDINMQNKNGNTALHILAGRGKGLIRPLKLLLGHPDINLSIKNFKDQSYLDILETKHFIYYLTIVDHLKSKALLGEIKLIPPPAKKVNKR